MIVFFAFHPEDGFAERLAVTDSIANIRSGPGTNNVIIWKVEKDHPLEIIEKKGNWYHSSDFEKDEGWIHKSLVGKVKTVITKKDNCNIRTGPGAKYKIIFTVEKGIPFRLLKRQGEWIKIRHADGDQGWIHNGLVW
ncbi:MAG: SH3 domain-containing protein [Deltaproteobacteria bacterium]|nr:SH3 domain-containing protein [Deltaproteobacteria bacterium]